ncbi:MAG: flippase-like domain-containing protein [Acidimicrobiaceae bacterium]|nr:flippase-like domain-containing protein [Acidimicrobiaceae bacterium]
MDPKREQAKGVHVRRSRALAGIAVMTVVVAGAVAAVYRERHSFTSTIHRLGAWPLIASLGCAVVGMAATGPSWIEVVRGLGVNMSWRTGIRVFFTTQLGKYVPGSIWPVLLQMEAGRAYGANRRTMVTANLMSLVLACTTGLLVAAVLLPASDAGALAHYWWSLLFLPVLLGLLYPRTIPALLDRLFALAHRPPLGERLATRSGLYATGYMLLAWLGLGGHLAVLCAALGHGNLSSFLLSTGAIALAYSVGILFLPAPAGAGIRDVVLAFVLTAILKSGQALAVVVASRVLLTACDILLAAASALILRGTGPRWAVTGSDGPGSAPPEG